MYITADLFLFATLVLCDWEDKSSELEDTIIEEHNKMRKNHKDTPALTKMSDNKYTRDRCQGKAAQKMTIGENTFKMSGKALTYDQVAKAVVLAWAKNKKDYKHGTENPSKEHLSYTQAMWKESKNVA